MFKILLQNKFLPDGKLSFQYLILKLNILKEIQLNPRLPDERVFAKQVLMPKKKKEDKGKGPANLNTQIPKQTLAQKAHNTAQKILKPSSTQPIKSWMDMVQEDQEAEAHK